MAVPILRLNIDNNPRIIVKADSIPVTVVYGTTLIGSGGTFQLNKTYTELSTVRAGEYQYQMDLHSATYPKRAFLSGSFTIIPNITT